MTVSQLADGEYLHYWKLKVKAEESKAFTGLFVYNPHFCIPYINCYCHWVFGDIDIDSTVTSSENYVHELIDQILYISSAHTLVHGTAIPYAASLCALLLLLL